MTKRRRPRVVGWTVLVGLLLAGLGCYLWFSGPRPAAPSDPRLTYAGPFRNIDPAVRYVADARCGECHTEKAQSYARHAMGRSLQPIARRSSPPTDAEHGNPFDALGSRFHVLHDGNAVRHRRTRLAADGTPIAEQTWEVHYTLGSGTHGHSYLTARDGCVFQTPVSWYSQKQVWDLSPGFHAGLLAGRAVQPDCLFCHANRVNPVEGSVNRYTQPVFDGHAIGCQRCHGPGELHIARHEPQTQALDGPDYTIVNPKHLERALREAVCEQCHLEGETRVVRRGRGLYDYRPGLPMELFWSAFLRADESGGRKAVGHVEQMYESRCFQAGGDGPRGMGCVSCHDPHESVPPATRVTYFRDRCLQCHAQQGCSLPQPERLRRSPQDSCIDCHMPRYGTSDIPHTASTDHRILRDPKAPRKPTGRGAAERLPFVSFYRDRPGTDENEDERDQALAVVRMALAGDPSATRSLSRVLNSLDAALRRAPDDVLVREARGHALGMQDRPAEALAAFEEVLAGDPDRERSLAGAATMAETLGRPEVALGFWRRAIAVNPWSVEYRRSLTQFLIRKEAWEEAQSEADAWLQLDPTSAEARVARVACLLTAGKKDEARQEFARVEALAPPNLRELQLRFEKKLK